MNNKLVDSHLGSDLPFGDINYDMFNVLKGSVKLAKLLLQARAPNTMYFGKGAEQ